MLKAPRVLPIHEMNMIIGGRKQGMTHKQIKAGVDSSRRMSGTYKGKGISTNTISRLLGKTHRETYRKEITTAWDKYDRYRLTRGQIKDKSKWEKWDKSYRDFTNRPKGRQNILEPRYKAETDEVYWESP